MDPEKSARFDFYPNPRHLFNGAIKQETGPVTSSKVEILEPQRRDLGDGFSVGRVLPAPSRRTVGPFVFFDHFGPVEFGPGKGIDVRPHPHIGLATITYLFEGEIVHRDSLGYEQPIRPGAVNWMTAGRGIVHSERTGPEERARTSRLHGLQVWVGLPKSAEETEPAFEHHTIETLPVIERPEATLRLAVGTAYGARAPVTAFSGIFYVDADIRAAIRLDLPTEHAERAVFVLEGAVRVGDIAVPEGRMAVIGDDRPMDLATEGPARVMLLGGAPLDGPRHLWWNFVSSAPERIERAKADWRAGRFGAVPGDDEFIPLPDS